MRLKLPVLFIVGAALALAHQPQATIRIEVRNESAPVQDAEVTVSGKQARNRGGLWCSESFSSLRNLNQQRAEDRDARPPFHDEPTHPSRKC